MQWGDSDDKQGGDSGVIEIDSRVTEGRPQGNRRVTVADKGVTERWQDASRVTGV